MELNQDILLLANRVGYILKMKDFANQAAQEITSICDLISNALDIVKEGVLYPNAVENITRALTSAYSTDTQMMNIVSQVDETITTVPDEYKAYLKLLFTSERDKLCELPVLSIYARLDEFVDYRESIIKKLEDYAKLSINECENVAEEIHPLFDLLDRLDSAAGIITTMTKINIEEYINAKYPKATTDSNLPANADAQ